MIEYVRLKNFMSFKDTMFDFRDGKKIKQMAAIYGENGSGKSTIVSHIKMGLHKIEP